MHPYYENLNITTYPLIDKVEDIIATWPDKKTSAMVPIDQLSPELLSLFIAANITVDKMFTLLHLNLDEGPGVPITGGNYEDPAQHKKNNRILWNFNSEISMKFYDKGDASPEFQPPTLKYPYRSSTTWTGPMNQVDSYTGTGPILTNPQIPHRSVYTEQGTRQIAVVLTCKDETYDTLRNKLAAYIVS